MELAIYILIGAVLSIIICTLLIKQNYLGLEDSSDKATIGLTIITIIISWPIVAFVFSFWLLSWLMGHLISIFIRSSK
jgi:hypothetical protein